ncbi:MAG: HsdR family type I site-specific deoxyribonuclease, partial [Acinetobacter sp.]
PKHALAERQHKNHEVVLRDILRGELKKRKFWHAGNYYPLSDKGIDTIINEVCNVQLNEGLLRSNERQYGFLLDGITITEFIDGKKAAATISLIDWQHIGNNRFDFTEEFSVLRSNGIDQRRPDIVCFINGIPIVVIEAKRPDGQSGKAPTISEGISQNIRNQRPDEIPHLFSYAQLLLSISGVDGRYGTTETSSKFWAAWREEDITETQMWAIKNKPLSSETLTQLFVERSTADRTWYDQFIAGGELAVSEQDKLLISLLQPTRLLEMIQFYMIYDKKVGKIIARYQQVFGIKRLIERVETKRPDGGRESGVIWHTTGSGKSFTMVFLSKALIRTESLKQCRILVVTDRIDLESQLSKTFASGGELSSPKDRQNAMMNTGRQLAQEIGQGTERIVFSLVQKFNTAAKLPECHNDSADIIVLIDEGHRSQGGENHIRMRQALPNASFVAFTGTPLLKDDKTTNKFGKIVHAYTMQRAVEDQTVTPLLYEERKPDLDINDRALDTWFERITLNLSAEQKTDLKKKFGRKGQIYQAEDRIRLIALDIAHHFSQNIQDGLKGQVACDSKQSAIKYKTFIDEAIKLLDPDDQFETAVVISAPDTREGNTDVDEDSIPEVAKWWKDNVGNIDEGTYTKATIERFETDPKLKLLIVVDKLLTGFDEPQNAVLYIDKPLKQHNLIQAIARVNRLHDKKKYGLLIDYRGILSELDTTIANYQDLANRTQGGFDIEDLQGL